MDINWVLVVLGIGGCILLRPLFFDREADRHRKELEKKYNSYKTWYMPGFIQETSLYLPTRDRPKRYERYGREPSKRGLYRHAWRRAVVLMDIAESNGDNEEVEKYKYLASMCSDLYYEHASEGLYGKAKLQISGEAQQKLRAFEIERIEEAREKRLGIKKKTYRGRVYLMYSPGNQLYKIGRTTQTIEKRLSGLRTGNPDIELVHEIPTDRPDFLEKKLHAQFNSKRIQREWFELSETDVERIKNERAES